jgi:hypothetical protein
MEEVGTGRFELTVSGGNRPMGGLRIVVGKRRQRVYRRRVASREPSARLTWTDVPIRDDGPAKLDCRVAWTC